MLKQKTFLIWVNTRISTTKSLKITRNRQSLFWWECIIFISCYLSWQPRALFWIFFPKRVTRCKKFKHNFPSHSEITHQMFIYYFKIFIFNKVLKNKLLGSKIILIRYNDSQRQQLNISPQKLEICTLFVKCSLNFSLCFLITYPNF